VTLSRDGVAAVIGRPIHHSLSPVIHGAWLEAAGLRNQYIALAPETPQAVWALLDSDTLLGCNVTAPYKEVVFDWARARGVVIGPEAAATRSVNLVQLGDHPRAENTDGTGLLAAIREQAPHLDLAPATIVVLGAGGAGRAAVQTVRSAGATDIRVVNRTRDRALELASEQGTGVAGFGLDEVERALTGSHLLINAASSLETMDLTPMSAGGAVMDMTYRPLETPLLARARFRGLAPIDGLAMLIGQARPSFEVLFGQPAPEIDVRRLCLEALEAQG